MSALSKYPNKLANLNKIQKITSVLLAFTTAIGISLLTQYIYNQTAKADPINDTDFVTTWRITDPGSTSITIPTTGGGYNYSVDWDNDGEVDESGITGNVTHDFGEVGDFTIRISGTFPRIYNISNGSNAAKLVDINQWGTNQWTSMDGAFAYTGLTELSATDAPDLSEVTNMTNTFYNATTFNSDLSNWDTSNVTDMYALFDNAFAFNGDISGWDTSNVTNMYAMFDDASSFNGDISEWETSKVTNMSYMFSDASSFNQDLSEWDTSEVTNMSYMFWGATAFNGDISGWETLKVTNMTHMFRDASAFNGNISEWNTSLLTDMSNMFRNATSFNGDISEWNTSNVTNMSYLFNGATSFNQDLPNWNTSNVTNMGSMFEGATIFNGNISGWNTSKVTDMSNMFASTHAFNQDISGWNTSLVTTMQGMFGGTKAFNQDLSEWNTSNVISMQWMFDGAEAFNGDISGWVTSSSENMHRMFSRTPVFNQDISGWDTSKVTNMSYMFWDAEAFDGDISGWNTSSVTNMNSMFYDAHAFSQDISGWDTSKVTNMNSMFQNAYSFDHNLGNWDVTSVTGMVDIFNADSSSDPGPLSSVNYDATLVGWAAQEGLQNNVWLGSNNLSYCSTEGKNARQYLITTYSWTFNSDAECALTAAPTDVQVNPSIYSAELSWTKPSGAKRSIFDYQIEYSTDDGETWDIFAHDASTETSIIVEELSAGTDYRFRVAGVNAKGAGTASSSVSTTTLTTVPDAPTDLQADPAAYSVSLSWIAPSRTGGLAVTNYVIEYSLDGDDWNEVERDPSTNTEYEVTGLNPVTDYYFRVAAVNDDGTSEFSAPITTQTIATVPDSPTNLQAEPSARSVTLSWNTPARDGGAAISNYVIEYSLDGEDWDEIAKESSTDTTHEATTLSPATSYSFRVAAVNDEGTSTFSDIVSTQTLTTVPDAPTNLQATPSTHSVTLNWDIPADNGGAAITDYIIEYSLNGEDWNEIVKDSSTNTVHEVSELSPATNYSFRVAAVNSEGAGEFSNAASTQTLTTVPGAPTNLQAEPSARSVTLNWDTPADNGGSAITNYIIEYSLDEGENWDEVEKEVSANTSYEVTSLNPATRYSFRVAAVNSEGTSAFSAPVSTQTLATIPGAPTNLQADPTSNTVTLTWDTPADNGGAAITNYVIEQSLNGEDWDEIIRDISTSTTYEVTGLSPVTSYHFRVAAVNSEGTSVFSTPVTTQTLATVPGVPTNLAANPAARSVELSWDAPASDGGAAITNYRIEYSLNGEDWDEVQRDSSTNTAYEMINLTPATNYYFRVAAVNSEGTSAFSDQATAQTLTTTPDTPTNLEATPTSNTVTLTWNAPADNGGAAITNYVIEQSVNGEDWDEVEKDDSTDTEYTVPGLTRATSYHFRVAAVNSEGTSAFSTLVTTQTLATVPGAPTNLEAVAATHAVSLTWNAPADNGGAAITTYHIQYSTNNGDTWHTVTHNPSTATEWTVEGLYLSIPYSFRVAAVNGAGTGAVSTVVQATPIVTPTEIKVETTELDDDGGVPSLPKRPTFSGVTIPLSNVQVTVHSDPVVCTTTAAADGKWSCTLPTDLVPGNHEVLVVITLPDNTTREYGPYAVTVPADPAPPIVVTEETPRGEGSDGRSGYGYAYTLYDEETNDKDTNEDDKTPSRGTGDDRTPREDDEELLVPEAMNEGGDESNGLVLKLGAVGAVVLLLAGGFVMVRRGEAKS